MESQRSRMGAHGTMSMGKTVDVGAIAEHGETGGAGHADGKRGIVTDVEQQVEHTKNPSTSFK